MTIAAPIAGRVHDAVAAVAPIHGVSVGDPADKSTWRIDFEWEATEAEKAAAAKALADFR